jgi:hypothetical protein
MLDLDICKKCLRENSVYGVLREIAAAKRTGLIACPYGYRGYWEATTDIEGAPPAHCPFKLEHGVSAAMGCKSVGSANV